MRRPGKMYSYERPKQAAAGETVEKFLEDISFKAYQALGDLDEKFVGTPNYMGFAYFWSTDYKHSLRDASTNKRRAVHRAFLGAGLRVDGSSPEHEAIIEKLVGL